jgi:hypothetical protein
MNITRSDTGFVLQSEAGETLTLSDQELAELVRDGHHLMHPDARFRPLATTKIEDVILSIDAHHTQAILRLIGVGGSEAAAFAIPGPKVRFLAQALAAKADLIDAAQSRKTEH